MALLGAGGKMSPRGIAGVALLYKILGAACKQGLDLDEVHALGLKVLAQTFTFGVAMEACSLPGKGKGHSLAADEIEIGMGIHGEKGREVTKWMKSADLVALLLSDLKKHYGKGELVVMVNNLGSVTALEMSLLVNDVLQWFEHSDDTVVRLVSGTVVGALNMNGISLTVLNASDLKVLDAVDLPVTTPFWPKVCKV